MKLNEYKILVSLIESEKFAMYCERMIIARANYLRYREPLLKDIIECVNNNKPLNQDGSYTINILNNIAEPVMTTLKYAIGKPEDFIQNSYFDLAIRDATFYAMHDIIFASDQPVDKLNLPNNYAHLIIRELSKYFIINGCPQEKE